MKNTQPIDITEVKVTLFKLIETVLKGEEVILGKVGKPIAKIVPLDPDTRPRVGRRPLVRLGMDAERF